MHSELEKFLELYSEPEFPPEEQEVDLSTRACCPKNCGEHYAKKNSKSYRSHPKDCWLNRENVEYSKYVKIHHKYIHGTPVTPVRQRTQDKLNAPWTSGMVAVVTMPSGETHSTVKCCILLADSAHYNTGTWVKYRTSLPRDFL